MYSRKAHTKPPVSLLGQMYWREFYYVVASATDNFDKMEGNSVCCQIPWDKNPEYLEAWSHVSNEHFTSFYNVLKIVNYYLLFTVLFIRKSYDSLIILLFS